MWQPNRILLISPAGRHDEAVSAANIYPGQLLTYNSSGLLIPHNIPGGSNTRMVCIEDALQGKDITQVLLSGNVIPFQRCLPGDVMLMQLQSGQTSVVGGGLMSAGDGTLMVNPGTDLFEIEAPSAVITNIGTEAIFSNGVYTIPASFLQVGDRIHIHAKAFVVAVNSTNTHRVRIYAAGIDADTVADSTALSLIASDVVIFDTYVTVRTIGATGTIIADGTVGYSISGTFTTEDMTEVSQTLNTTIANAITVTSLASATSAGNQIRLDEFQVNLERAAGLSSIGTAEDAINNSSGGTGPNSSAWVRVIMA
jgi:hypothetical protein